MYILHNTGVGQTADLIVVAGSRRQAMVKTQQCSAIIIFK